MASIVEPSWAHDENRTFNSCEVFLGGFYTLTFIHVNETTNEGTISLMKQHATLKI